MRILRLVLKDFRCFNHLELMFNKAPVVLLQGPNGSGKTSILEALYYMCYLRSFRTYGPQDLIYFGKNLFFIQVLLEKDNTSHEVSVGFMHKKKNVKIDQKSVASYKELLDHLKIISVCEDDLCLIKGSPEERRNFIDQALLLLDPSFIQTLRLYRQKLAHKNALLYKKNVSQELYAIWTDQVLTQSDNIKQRRIKYIHELQGIVDYLIKHYLGKDVHLTFSYQTKQEIDIKNTHDLYMLAPMLYQQECIMGRSLYGAHLDDIACIFSGKLARSFASRGQQKLSVLLIKAAQLIHLKQSHGTAIMLIDDFMTDFDMEHAQKLFSLLKTISTQLIFTSPLSHSPLDELLKNDGAQVVSVSK